MNGVIENNNTITGKITTTGNLIGEIDVIKEAVDTRDATAISSDILLNKTAYARGEKLIGTYEGIIPTGTLTITENGEQNVYNYANVDVQIDTGSSIDWTEIGYTQQPSIIEEGFDYAKQIMQNWDSSITDRNAEFKNNGKLLYFPNVDTSNLTIATEMFYNSPVISIGDNFDFSHITNGNSMFQNSNIKYINNLEFGNAILSSTFAYVNDLTVNNFTTTSNSSSTCFTNNNNLKINTMNIRNGSRAIFSNCTNLDIAKINNYDNHKARTRSILNNSNTMSDRTIDEFLKYFKTLTNQSSTNKNLKTMGFSQTNVNQALLSSEWTGLSSDGWITGY